MGLLAWILRRRIRESVRRLNAGDYGPLLAGYAPDAVLVFPGRHSWAGVHRGRDEIERFLRRFVRMGIRGEVHDVLVAGPPWRLTVCVLFTDELAGPHGSRVYANRAVLVARFRRGKIVHQEDYVDTQRVAELDGRLEELGLAR